MSTNAGHPSRAMLSRYSHVRREAKRASSATFGREIQFPVVGDHSLTLRSWLGKKSHGISEVL
jgi:hypothetical protein